EVQGRERPGHEREERNDPDVEKAQREKGHPDHQPRQGGWASGGLAAEFPRENERNHPEQDERVIRHPGGAEAQAAILWIEVGGGKRRDEPAAEPGVLTQRGRSPRQAKLGRQLKGVIVVRIDQAGGQTDDKHQAERAPGARLTFFGWVELLRDSYRSQIQADGQRTEDEPVIEVDPENEERR